MDVSREAGHSTGRFHERSKGAGGPEEAAVHQLWQPRLAASTSSPVL